MIGSLLRSGWAEAERCGTQIIEFDRIASFEPECLGWHQLSNPIVVPDMISWAPHWPIGITGHPVFAGNPSGSGLARHWPQVRVAGDGALRIDGDGLADADGATAAARASAAAGAGAAPESVRTHAVPGRLSCVEKR